MSRSNGPQEENCNRGDDYPWKHVLLLNEGRMHGRKWAFPGSVIKVGDPLAGELIKAGLGRPHDGPEAYAEAPAEDGEPKRANAPRGGK